PIGSEASCRSRPHSCSACCSPRASMSPRRERTLSPSSEATRPSSSASGCCGSSHERAARPRSCGLDGAREARSPREGDLVKIAARRVLVVAALAAVLVVVLASPAFAHASLESTNPAPGAVLTGTPNAITLQFSEPVTVALGGVRLYNQNGDRIATDPPT